MKTVDQKTNFILKARRIASALLEVKEFQLEYDATDAGSVLVAGDFVGRNEGIEIADVVNFEASVVPSVLTLLENEGVRTILENIKG